MKIRSMLAAACACLITSGSILSFTTALPAQAAFDLGDFDGNDSIDVDDAVSVLTFYAKAAAGVAVDDLSDEQFDAAYIDKAWFYYGARCRLYLNLLCTDIRRVRTILGGYSASKFMELQLGKPLIMTCCFLEQFQTLMGIQPILLFGLTKMTFQNYW